MPRRHLTLGLACAALAVAIAVGIVLVARRASSKTAPTRAEYLEQRRGDLPALRAEARQDPAPVDVSIPAEITESVRKVEPILRAEADAVRRLEPPRELRAQLARWNELNRRSIAKLGEALRAAKKTDLRGIQVAYVAFVVTGAKAQKLGHAIGFPSPPC